MEGNSKNGPRLVYLLLFAPYVALMWVGSYDRAKPVLFGIPFFYWYQLLWIPFSAVLIYFVYRAVEGGKRP